MREAYHHELDAGKAFDKIKTHSRLKKQYKISKQIEIEAYLKTRTK